MKSNQFAYIFQKYNFLMHCYLQKYTLDTKCSPIISTSEVLTYDMHVCFWKCVLYSGVQAVVTDVQLWLYHRTKEPQLTKWDGWASFSVNTYLKYHLDMYNFHLNSSRLLKLECSILVCVWADKSFTSRLLVCEGELISKKKFVVVVFTIIICSKVTFLLDHNSQTPQIKC